MTEQDIVRLLLNYLDRMRPGCAALTAVKDLAALPASELLDLAAQLPDEVFLLYVQVLKASGEAGLFAKLMGEHEEFNRQRVNAFFHRYMELVLEPAERQADFNPLLYYIPPDAFQDLGFIQSREAFFKRQTIAHINEFLAVHFELPAPFSPGAEEQAWNFFFGELIRI